MKIPVILQKVSAGFPSPATDYVQDEIRTSVRTFIPNLEIKSIRVTAADQDEEEPASPQEDEDSRLFRVSDYSTKPYTAKVRVDYDINNEPFVSSDFIIINI